MVTTVTEAKIKSARDAHYLFYSAVLSRNNKRKNLKCTAQYVHHLSIHSPKGWTGDLNPVLSAGALLYTAHVAKPASGMGVTCGLRHQVTLISEVC